MSSKFKITLKLQGFELQVEGSREDIPMLTKNVSAQLAGMLMPATNMVEGHAPVLPPTRGQSFDNPNTTTPSPAPAKRGKTRRTSTAADRKSGAAGSKEILWQHDANAWGTPLQTWKAPEKAVWLLYVANQSAAAAEMTVGQMVATFDRLFRSSGRLNKGNVARDFQALNSEPPPKVAMNGTVDPATWYLTDAGNKLAERLVKQARGETASNG
jgi:hypothetical protein